MQNLIDDPVFYNLLVNNRESSTSSASSATTKSPELQHQQPQPQQKDAPQPVKNEVVDFSFLNNVEFPLMNNNNNTLNIPKNESTTTPSEMSYQNSIFSDSLSIADSGYDAFDIGSINDLLSKDITFQISSELPQQEPSVGFPNQTQTKPPTPKQFHKFYTSTINQSEHLETSTSRVPISCSSSAINKPQLTYHKCPFCQRQFNNKSYLSRHLKKHYTVKDFKCPFFNEEHTKCHHLNGEFSRKDTFKAHLKSIHFIYPIGVAKSDRNLSIGRCAGCFQEFKTNNEWMNEHIEKETCPGFAANKSVEPADEME